MADIPTAILEFCCLDRCICENSACVKPRGIKALVRKGASDVKRALPKLLFPSLLV